MQIKTVQLSGYVPKAALVVGCVLFVVLCLLTVKWSFGSVAAVRAEDPEVSELGVRLAGRDPQAHFRYASLLESTLLAGDQERARRGFEMAAARSPYHYEYWLALGRSREQEGDVAGAERALRRAAGLAPNYSRVHWALGNALLRQGRSSEAFNEIRIAVTADQTFAAPAASTAFLIFGGDVQKISEAIGDSPRIKASLAVQLANAKRFDESKATWRSVSADEKRSIQADIAKNLYSKFVEGGKYAAAIEVATETGLFREAEAAVGSISNGEFESALTEENANAFGWSIAGGTQPRIGLNEDRKHGGKYSLLISFGTRGSASRPVTQKVAVESGAYTLRFVYRSELSGEAQFRCDVLLAGSSDLIAGVVLPAAADWTEMKIDLVVPADSEGIDIKLSNTCPGTGCTVSGSIWFDDFNLSKR